MTDKSGMPVPIESPSLLNRTLRTFRRAWRSTSLSTHAFVDSPHGSLSNSDAEKLRQQFHMCLDARSGEVHARALAAALGATYLGLNEKGRRRFSEILGQDFDNDDSAIEVAVADYQNASEGARNAARRKLRAALVPPRVRLLTRFNELSLGVKFLVDLRADIRRMADPGPALRGLDRDLRELLISWFDIGFLDFTRITWQTPAALLEKLIEYEAVHAIRSWDDLKHRLDEDRRCYAFFHPCMPDEPLIFVQVALVDGLAPNVYELLDEDAPGAAAEHANTAIFYSISNCQAGLAGVSFGNFLIKQVVADLGNELPNLKTFSTLSPIPGFNKWLKTALADDAADLIPETLGSTLERADDQGRSAQDIISKFLLTPEMLTDSDVNPALLAALESTLIRLCARYLLIERRGNTALDRVAHFHLTNGARVERINWLGDRSEAGLRSSLGLMVNYRYVLADVDENHENYVTSGTIAAVTAVRKLLKP
jgi:malonyl-CoA decarboxylase